MVYPTASEARRGRASQFPPRQMGSAQGASHSA